MLVTRESIVIIRDTADHSLLFELLQTIDRKYDIDIGVKASPVKVRAQVTKL